MIAASIRSGTIGTFAGIGAPGYRGDGAPAASACLNEPKSLALDGSGRLYIADSENHVIRMVDLATGLIRTVAGAEAAPAPAAGGHPAGEPFEPDPLGDDPLGGPKAWEPITYTQSRDLSGTVRFVVGTAPKTGRFSGDGGPATRAALNFPSAVAVDADGNLYIADTMNHRVRKVDARTGSISTIAGTGQHRFSGDGGSAVSAALNEPTALVEDGRGRLYIADQSNNRVRKLDLVTGIMTTVAGTGEAAYTRDGMPATEASLAGPSGLALGPDRALYIADTFNGRIRRVDHHTGLISTVVGDGGDYRYDGQPNEISTSLCRPYGVALDRHGHILITDSDSHLIRRWDRSKKIIVRVAGNGVAQFEGDGGSPLACSLNYPFGVAVDLSGNIYIADTFNHRIRMIAV